MSPKSKEPSPSRLRRGDIYWIDFPAPYGPHFALIVSSNERNTFGADVLVAQITSQRADEIAHDEVQLPSEILSRPSKVKCYHILAIQKDRLLPENLRGDVDVRTMQGIDEALKIALDLW